MLSNLKRWFQDKIGIGENRDKIFYLEKQVKLNHILIQQVLPEALDFNTSERSLNFLRAENLSALVSYKIHKNDLMFLSSLLAKDGHVDASLNEYFSVGLETARTIKQAVGEKTVHSFLDFGAGYGRVSRFLPHFFGPSAEIFTSDIKPESVKFNVAEFGFSPVHHSPEAVTFTTTQKFDVIFAGSVFTHLPQKLAESWLDVLAAALHPGGYLVFSVHNKTSFGMTGSEDFIFKNLSEDSFFASVDDSIKDGSLYGSAFVSSALVNKWMTDRHLDATVKHNGFGGTQDLVIGQKNN